MPQSISLTPKCVYIKVFLTFWKFGIVSLRYFPNSNLYNSLANSHLFGNYKLFSYLYDFFCGILIKHLGRIHQKLAVLRILSSSRYQTQKQTYLILSSFFFLFVHSPIFSILNLEVQISHRLNQLLCLSIYKPYQIIIQIWSLCLERFVLCLFQRIFGASQLETLAIGGTKTLKNMI